MSNNIPESLVFTLEKKAKSGGGDKYVCDTQQEFNIYVPQTISRKDNVPHSHLYITINTEKIII